MRSEKEKMQEQMEVEMKKKVKMEFLNLQSKDSIAAQLTRQRLQK